MRRQNKKKFLGSEAVNRSGDVRSLQEIPLRRNEKRTGWESMQVLDRVMGMEREPRIFL